MALDLPIDTLVSLAMVFVAAGAAIGLLAGLFGVGGGAISVPVYFETFRYLGISETISMPLAVGTSLAMILPTAILSARTHARHGTVDGALIRAWIVPVLAGVMAGAFVARNADPALFQVVFAVMATIVALRLLTGSTRFRLRDTMPGVIGTSLYGIGVGLVSALMGVGGGAISNMVLTLNGRTMHQAVSTSAAVGVLIAVPGTIGYILAGWGKPGLPPDAVGFVSLAALTLTLPAALLTTRLGVRLAHTFSARLLSRLFGIFLLIVAIRFVVQIAT